MKCIIRKEGDQKEEHWKAQALVVIALVASEDKLSLARERRWGRASEREGEDDDDDDDEDEVKRRKQKTKKKWRSEEAPLGQPRWDLLFYYFILKF